MDLLEIMRQRRSVRSYTSEDVSEENIRKILEAGLLSASGRAIRPWELIVVKDKSSLQKMAESRDHGAKMLEGANAAIAVIADEKKNGCMDGRLLYRNVQHASDGKLPRCGELLDTGASQENVCRRQHRRISEETAGIPGALPIGGCIVSWNDGEHGGSAGSDR